MREFLVRIAATIFVVPLTFSPTPASASVAEGLAQTLILETRDLIEGLQRDDVSTPGHQVALANFYRQALEAIEAGDLAEALKKLEDARDRSDGCTTNDSPDTRGGSADWVTNCSAQIEIVQSTDLASVLITSLTLGYSEDSLAGPFNAGEQDFLNPIGGAAYVFDFQPDNTGNVIFGQGDSPVTWSVNAAGEIEVSLIDPPETVSFPFCDSPTSPVGQCRAITSVQALRVLRISNTPRFDQVFVLPTTVTTYPDDPLPDEIIEQLPDLDSVFLAFSDDEQLPFDTAALTSTPVAVTYSHRENASVGWVSESFGTDLLTFNSDSSGFTQRRGFIFSWQQNQNGGLDIEFENGDTNRYMRYDGAGGSTEVYQAVHVSRTATEGSVARAFYLVESDGVTEFTDNQIANRRYEIDLGDFVLAWAFLPDGAGCRNPDGDFTPIPLLWESSAERYMDYIAYSSTDFIIPRERRSWQAVRVEPGILGPRYWVIENVEFTAFDPAYVFVEPEFTPGRLNAYEFTDDLGDNVDPCGFGD